MSDDFDKDLSWLDDDDSDNDTPADDSDDTFDWQHTDTGERSGPPPDRLGVTGELSWRMDPGKDESEDEDDDELPGWLRSDTEPPEESDDKPESFPDWMQGIDEEEFTRQTTELPPLASESADVDDDNLELPDWLLDAADSDEVEEEELPMPEFDDAPLDESPQEESDLPDWLRGADEDLLMEPDPDAVPVEQVPEPEPEIPEWLRGTEAEEAPEVDEPDLVTHEPDWIQDVAETSAQLDDETLTTQPVEDQELAEDEETIPLVTSSKTPQTGEEVDEWLRDAAPEDLPEWLHEEAEKVAEEEDLEALFGDVDIDSVLEESGSSPSLTMFGEDDFAAEVEERDDFDMLSQLKESESPQLDELLGEEDGFDLLGELTEDQGEDFDLMEVLSQEDGSTDEDEASEMPDTGAFTAEDVADYDALFAVLDAAESPDEDADRLFSFDDDEEETPQPAAQVFDDESPDWLQDIDADDIPDMPEKPKAPAEPANVQDLDSYLASLGGENALALPEDHDLAALSADVDLDEIFAQGDEAARSRQPRQKQVIELPPDAPEWLTQASQEATSEDSAAAIVRRRKDRPVDELPERLRSLHDRGLELPSEPGVTVAADALPGVSGSLPPVVFDPGPASIGMPLTLTDDQRDRADILRALVGGVRSGETLDTEAESVQTGRRVRVPLERLLITVLLIVVMVLPFIGGADVGDLPPAQFEAGSSQQIFFEQIDRLSPGELILVAVEYGPGGAAEMDYALAALLRHVLSRRALPVIVGGNPIGMLYVSNMMETLAEANGLEANRDYVVGRYLVGEAVGLRDFGERVERLTSTDIYGTATGLTVESLDDFALAVVIADRADRVRAWAEQIRPQLNNPLLVITGAGASPLSEPYMRASGNIGGMMIGYRDGYTYNHILDHRMGFVMLPTETPEPTATEIPTATDEPPEPTPDVTPATGATDEAQIVVPTAISPEATEAPTETLVPTKEPSSTPTPTITPSPTASPTPTPEPVTLGTIIADVRVNVRSGPSTNAAPVGSLAPGEQVVILSESEDGEWYEVPLPDGQIGWVASFLVETEIIPDPTTLTPPVPSAAAAALGKRLARESLKPVPPGQDEPAPELTPEVTQESDPGFVPIAPLDDNYRDERWHSMTLGIVVIVLVIAGGNIINLVRALRRRRQQNKR